MADLKLTIEKYPKGSVVFIEGNKESSNFYIIKEGTSKSSRINEVVDDPKLSILNVGDCFGVISCMGRRPRIETITALTDLSLVSIKEDQFDDLIQTNTPIALKIIKLFSRKLRTFDSQIARVTLKRPADEDLTFIYNIGEYYQKQGMKLQAYGAYKRYLKYCPTTSKAAEVKNKIAELIKDLPSMEEFRQTGPVSKTYFDGALICCEHEPGDELYIIQDGKVKVTKIIGDSEVLLAVLNPGDTIGEMAILDNKPRSATAMAYGGEVSVYAINKDNFETTVKTNPSIVKKIIQLLSERIWVAYRQLENVLLSDNYGRILDTMLIQIERERIKIAPRTSYSLDFGPNELINMVGFSPEKGAPLIQQLLSNKNYESIDGKIVIKDIQELVKQVEAIKVRQKPTQ